MVYIIDKCHTNYIIKMQFLTKDSLKLYQSLPKKGLTIVVFFFLSAQTNRYNIQPTLFWPRSHFKLLLPA